MSDVRTIARRIVPESMRQVLRGNYNSVWNRFVSDPLQRIQLLFYRLRGGGYQSWYAKRLNSYTGKTGEALANLEYMKTGQEDLSMLKKAGLMPYHYLYEFGIGHGRSSQYFIEYLESEHFFGNDASAGRVAEARSYLDYRGLMTKKPTLYVTNSNDFSWLAADQKFDFFWSSAVLCHMPDDDVREVLAHLRNHLTPASVALISDTHLDNCNTNVRFTVKDWFRPASWYISLAESLGYKVEDLSRELPSGTQSFSRHRRVGANEKYTISSHLLKLSLAMH